MSRECIKKFNSYACNGAQGPPGSAGPAGPAGNGVTGGTVVFQASVGTGPDPATQTTSGPFDVTLGSLYYIYSQTANLFASVGSILIDASPPNRYAFANEFTGAGVTLATGDIYTLSTSDFSSTFATGMSFSAGKWTVSNTGSYNVATTALIVGITGAYDCFIEVNGVTGDYTNPSLYQPLYQVLKLNKNLYLKPSDTIQVNIGNGADSISIGINADISIQQIQHNIRWDLYGQ